MHAYSPDERAPLPADDRPESNWSDPRRAITHALACGPRLGWAAVEGVEGEFVTVTYTRGNGSVAQAVSARFCVVITAPRTPVDFWRFSSGEVTTCDEPRTVTTWGAIMAALYRPPLKARRAPKGTRAGTSRRPARSAHP